jgi:hypothetical protein
MKIAWFTPFNIKNATGKYSKSVTTALSKFSDVDLFLSEQEDTDTINLKTIHYNPENVLLLLECYDMCVYNITDCLEYNKLIYNVMRRRHGIVIFHNSNLFESNITKDIFKYSLGFVFHSNDNITKLKYSGPACVISYQFNNESYSEKLYDFIQFVNFLKPLYSLTGLISQELDSIGVSSDMKILEKISNEIEYLYAKRKSC